MSIYQYRAVNFAGQKVSGEMEAANAIDLESRLDGLDLMLLRCSEKSNSRRGLFSTSSLKMTRRDLINFTFQMERLVVGGVAVLDGLRDIRDSAESPTQQYAAGLLVESIQSGSSISAAMEGLPESFDSIYVSLIRTGEVSGNLGAVLKELTESLKWQDELSEQVRSLIFYPSIILTVVLLSVTFTLTYLVPKMKVFIVQTLNQELPWYTNLLLGISDFMVDYWYLVFSVPLFLIIAIVVAIKTLPPINFLFHRLLLELPLFGTLFRKIALARFASMFALMYGSGVSVLDSLKYGETTIGNLFLGQAVNRVRLLVTQGSSLAEGFSRTGLFPALVIRMVKVGESTGSIEESLRTVSYFYQRDIRDFVQKLLRLIEPALTLFLGGMLFYIMLAIILPIYDSISKQKIF